MATNKQLALEESRVRCTYVCLNRSSCRVNRICYWDRSLFLYIKWNQNGLLMRAKESKLHCDKFPVLSGGYSSVHFPMLLTFWTQSFVFVLLLIRKREITHILISYTQSSYKVHSDFFYYRRVKVYFWRLFNCLRCNRLSLYTYTAHLNTRRKVSPWHWSWKSL